MEVLPADSANSTNYYTIICLNNASWFDHGLDKSSEAFSRSVSQMLKANPPHSFRRFIFNADSDQRLAFSAPTAFATLTPSNVRFVHLNATTEPITPQPHHRSSQLVQPLPRSFIATRLKNTGQPKGVGTIFLGGDMPHHSKPQAQRFVGSVENSTGRYRFLNPDWRQCHRPRFVRHASLEPQFGHTKPFGQRRLAR